MDMDVDMDNMDMDARDEDASGSRLASIPALPGIQVVAKESAKRYQNSDVPLATWLDYRDEYLDDLMCLEGRGNYQQACAGCNAPFPNFRCKDCTLGALWCQACLVKRHSQSPLHIVEMWNGLFFQQSTLMALGLRVQLSHPPGRFCPTKEPGHKFFAVIDANGIHSIAVNFCRCVHVEHRTQLLRIGWWPATPLEPQTCATMSVLQHVHLLNLQGNITGYSFYRALEYQTDNTGLHRPSDHLPAFMLMAREWRHMKMVKHTGRAFDPGGIKATAPGSLAIPCRACPLPNINLPHGWENVPPERAWLYMLMVTMDANFRLRSKLRGLQSKDPTLMPGWAYFVNNGPYSDFIKDYVDQDEIRTCVGFQALLNMLTKKSKGLHTTGLATMSCTRHQLFRPLSMGDLQKGERQCNMDYLFTSSVAGTVGLRQLAVSYDVGCQWFTNFWRRMPSLPAHLHLPFSVSAVKALVPKFHLQSHEEKCHSPFSFNFFRGAGRAEGEGMEHNWDMLNGHGPSTAEMVPGHRWETLDDCCGWVNWRKTMGLGNLLLKRLLVAIPHAIQTCNDIVALTSSLRAENPDELTAMENELQAWEADKSKPDPYRLPKSNVTLTQVRLVMAEEEKVRAEEGATYVHDVSAGAFLLLGTEIQNLQQTLHHEVSGLQKQTLLQTTFVVEWQTVLLKRVQHFRKIQHIYMPGFNPRYYNNTDVSDSNSNSNTPMMVENTKLYMPSELSASNRRKFCPNGLASLEDRIRFAEASDSLEDLQHHLRTRSFTNKFKIANVTGQRKNTRAREVQHRIDDKVRASELQYRQAQEALKQLRGPGDWEITLKVLEKSDVRALNERELNQEEQDKQYRLRQRLGINVDDMENERVVGQVAAVGEGYRRPLWIWFTSASTAEAMNDPLTRQAIRVEWAKAKARTARWEEEVILLDEEMRRVLQFCDWKAKWWRNLLSLRTPDDNMLSEGLATYTAQQAAQELDIAQNWEAKWKAAVTRRRIMWARARQ
ncbi:hypothetical protein PILCRDRAFT_7683 [Piloderma croceum F 1598]|uniref:CxC2-like cysteine cluster KDZ transposase-associated domain-containing protein n=1 Tax=Piloderma croceum (strain F 1598) TaxID=765440 RepID=A0A0C3BZI2_PILCF|nr:hypothetical protein PILCRDRAFT_7683 [Piloderma croceum F 1598]